MRQYPFESAYQQCLNYAPPHVKSILAKEIPRIKENIDREVTLFGERLSRHIEDEVQKEKANLQKASEKLMEEINTIVNSLPQNSALENVTAELKEKNDEFQNVVEKAAGALGSAVTGAIRSSGLQIFKNDSELSE